MCCAVPTPVLSCNHITHHWHFQPVHIHHHLHHLPHPHGPHEDRGGFTDQESHSDLRPTHTDTRSHTVTYTVTQRVTHSDIESQGRFLTGRYFDSNMIFAQHKIYICLCSKSRDFLWTNFGDFRSDFCNDFTILFM